MTTESQQHINTDNDEISLKDLILKVQDWWRYLLSKWIIILFFGLLGGSLGFWYATLKKPVYTATTTFVLEDEKNGGALGSLGGLASVAGIDLGGGGGGIFQGENILGLYRSRTMLAQTLLSPINIEGRQELLVNRYIEFSGLKTKWADKPKLSTLTFATNDSVNKHDRLKDSILGIIISDLNKKNLLVAKPDKKLSTIQVDVKAEDELFAKAFNDVLVKNVNEFYINTKTKKTLQNVKILQRKTDSVRRGMNRSIYSAVAIADATPNLNPTRQVQRIAPVQKEQYSAETNKSILAEMVKNLEMTKMSLLKETPLIQVIDYPIYPLKKDKVSFLFSIFSGVIFGLIAIVIYLTLKRQFRSIMLQ